MTVVTKLTTAERPKTHFFIEAKIFMVKWRISASMIEQNLNNGKFPRKDGRLEQRGRMNKLMSK